MAKRDPGKPKKQIAALPVARDAEGALRTLVITSRDTRQLIVPKGWPMKGVKDYRAAEIEAREEAGLIGRAHRKPIGSYLSWKRRADHFDLVRVKVYLFDVSSQLDSWKEKGQRDLIWLKSEDAADLVDSPGLSALLRDLPSRLPEGWRTRAKKAERVKAVTIG